MTGQPPPPVPLAFLPTWLVTHEHGEEGLPSPFWVNVGARRGDRWAAIILAVVNGALLANTVAIVGPWALSSAFVFRGSLAAVVTVWLTLLILLVIDGAIAATTLVTRVRRVGLSHEGVNLVGRFGSRLVPWGALGLMRPPWEFGRPEYILTDRTPKGRTYQGDGEVLFVDQHSIAAVVTYPCFLKTWVAREVREEYAACANSLERRIIRSHGAPSVELGLTLRSLPQSPTIADAVKQVAQLFPEYDGRDICLERMSAVDSLRRMRSQRKVQQLRRPGEEPRKVAGLAVGGPGSSQGASVYIELLKAPEAYGYILAHEFMHLGQRRFRSASEARSSVFHRRNERLCDLQVMARCGDKFPWVPSSLALPKEITRENWSQWAQAAAKLAKEEVEKARMATSPGYDPAKSWEDRFRELVLAGPQSRLTTPPAPG